MHVAVVSFGYPPMPHVAGTRAYYMAQHLVRLGHRVTVLTVDWRLDAVEEPSDSAKVVRIDPRSWNPEFSPKGPPFTTERLDALHPVLRRLRTLRRTLRWGPYESWARAGVRALISLHEADPIDVSWAIHGDDSSHEIAYRLWRRARVPWVADFKDPWHLFHQPIARPIQKWVTARRLGTAASITETSAGQGHEDQEFGRPWQLIWSGYDTEMMERAVGEPPNGVFALTHLGHMSVQHDIGAVPRLLVQLRSVLPEDAKFELRVYGHHFDTLLAAARAVGVESLISVRPFVSHAKAFAVMKGASALVLLPATPSLGVKELEYMASGTPVVCLGRLANELQPAASRLKHVLQADSLDRAARFLSEDYDAFAKHRASPHRGCVNHPVVAAFGWDAQAKKLESVLRSAARSSD